MSLRSDGLAPLASLPSELLRLPQLPRPMHIAFWVQLAGAAAGSLPFVIRLVTFNAASVVANARTEAAQKHERVFPTSDYVGGFVFAMVLGALFVAGFVVLAFLVRRGLNSVSENQPEA